MTKAFEVQTQFANGEWENTWTEDDEPLTFKSRAEAKAAILDLKNARIAAGMTLDRYRIQPTAGENA